MSRDIRKMLAEIRSSLDAHPREALTEILAQLFKEYVVDGPAPVGAGASLLLNARSEIDGMSFSQLIAWIQSHHDAPELSQFEIQGDRVLVRVAGRLQPIDAPGAAPSASPPVAASAAAPVATQATVRPMPVSQTPPVNTGRPAPAPAAAAPSRPVGQASTPDNPTQPSGQPAAAAPAAADKAAPRDDSGDPASRFSYLEVD